MKIVIISRVILPFQAPRPFRATELAKGFARLGHDVTLYGVLGKYDYSEFEASHNVKVKNIGKMKFAVLNSDGEENSSFLRKVLTRLFKNILEFPDIELMFKIPGILKKEIGTDLLITVAVPYPIHWGAALSKAQSRQDFPKTWVADCGDPYMGNAFKKHPFYFQYLEKWFCREADYITVPIEEAKAGYYNEFHPKIKVIPQGFNFEEVKIDFDHEENQRVTFIYAGAFYKDIRDPRLLLDYLSTLEKDFRFIIYTKHQNLVKPYLSILGDKLELHDFIPRLELLKKMSKADFLVNFENGTSIQSPSKLIDYALAKRPILSLGSQKLEQEKVDEFLSGVYKNKMTLPDIEQFNIKNVVDKFIRLVKK